MAKMNSIDWIAWVLLIIGGINWGLTGVFNYNLVEALLGSWQMIAKIVYGAVGISGLYAAWTLYKLATK